MVDMSMETRSLTVMECMKRLHQQYQFPITKVLASSPPNTAALTTAEESTKLGTTLTIHLVGADHREGNSGRETCAIFDTLLGSVANDPRFHTLRLVLVGPNIARQLHHTSYSHVWTSSMSETESSTGIAIQSQCQLEIQYFVSSFDAYFQDKLRYLRPDLAVCFNAGIWGYDDWLPTLQLLLHTIQTPLLVTSYNESEAGDDEDVLDTLAPPRWFWRAEENPFGSPTHRATNNSYGSILKENNYWMCLGPAERNAYQ